MNILIIESDPDIIQLIMTCLQSTIEATIAFYVSPSLNRAIDLIETTEIHIIISDLILTDSDNAEKTFEALKAYVTIPFIIISNLKDLDVGLNAMKMGAVDFISKPFDCTRLKVAYQCALAKKTGI